MGGIVLSSVPYTVVVIRKRLWRLVSNSQIRPVGIVSAGWPSGRSNAEDLTQSLPCPTWHLTGEKSRSKIV